MKQDEMRIQRLEFYEEAVGTLYELTVDQGFLIAQISKVILALPTEIENKLRLLIGARIGILHTDIPGKEYLVRVISEPGMEKALKADNTRQFAQGFA
jgi:hypothetical protein